jgi:hypothetical protein
MGRPALAFCRLCRKPVANRSVLSARRKCPACGALRYVENALQLNAHSGPWFEHWRAAMAACVGAALLDEPREPT